MFADIVYVWAQWNRWQLWLVEVVI